MRRATGPSCLYVAVRTVPAACTLLHVRPQLLVRCCTYGPSCLYVAARTVPAACTLLHVRSLPVAHALTCLPPLLCSCPPGPALERGGARPAGEGAHVIRPACLSACAHPPCLGAARLVSAAQAAFGIMQIPPAPPAPHPSSPSQTLGPFAAALCAAEVFSSLVKSPPSSPYSSAHLMKLQQGSGSGEGQAAGGKPGGSGAGTAAAGVALQDGGAAAAGGADAGDGAAAALLEEAEEEERQQRGKPRALQASGAFRHDTSEL